MSEHGIIHSRSQGLIDFAYRFAKEAHVDQKRKYTFEPYINHPVAVANIVASVSNDCGMICAALLHDVLEDTDTTFKDIVDCGLGYPIASLVLELTDMSIPSDGNRAARKEIDRQHLAKASDKAQTVKLADLIDNTSSICAHDPNFAKVYMKEKEKLLEVLFRGDSRLYKRAKGLVDSYFNNDLEYRL